MDPRNRRSFRRQRHQQPPYPGQQPWSQQQQHLWQQHRPQQHEWEQQQQQYHHHQQQQYQQHQQYQQQQDWQQHPAHQQQHRQGLDRRQRNSTEDVIPVSTFEEEGVTLCPVASCGQQLPPNFTQADFGFVFSKGLDEVLNTTKGERRKLIMRFLRMVNTLMNQGGGIIYIHTEPHLLNFWDEQVDEDLMSLVSDDSLFDENYERYVEQGHVIFRVKPRDRPLSTLDFQSKVSLNKGLDDPTHGQMRRLMTRPYPEDVDPSPPSRDVFPPDVPLVAGHPVVFHENLNVQAKVVLQNDLSHKTPRDLTDKVSKLLHFWWTHLKLPAYIVAFAKQSGGGSFFLGLREDKRVTGTKWKELQNTRGLQDVFGTDLRFWADDKNTEEKRVFHLAREEDVPKHEHKSGRFLCEGVALSEQERQRLKEQLERRVRDHLPRFPNVTEDGHDHRHHQGQDQPLVELRFHPVHEKENGDADDADREGRFHEGRGHWNNNNNNNNFTNRGGAGTPGEAISSSRTRAPSDLCVVEARVAFYHGVCFQNSCGPEAYRFDHDTRPTQAVRVPVEQWVEAQA